MEHQGRFSLRNLYLYSICLITLLISIFAIVSLVRTGVGLFYPDPYIYATPSIGGPSKHDLLAAAHRESILSLVGSATTLVLAVPLYLYHWSKVQSEKTPQVTE